VLSVTLLKDWITNWLPPPSAAGNMARFITIHHYCTRHWAGWSRKRNYRICPVQYFVDRSNSMDYRYCPGKRVLRLFVTQVKYYWNRHQIEYISLLSLRNLDTQWFSLVVIKSLSSFQRLTLLAGCQKSEDTQPENLHHLSQKSSLLEKAED